MGFCKFLLKCKEFFKFGATKFHFLKYNKFFSAWFILYFFEIVLKSGPAAAYCTTPKFLRCCKL